LKFPWKGIGKEENILAATGRSKEEERKKKKKKAGATFDGKFVYLNIVSFDVGCISLKRKMYAPCAH